MATVTGLRNYSDIAAGVKIRAGEQCDVPDSEVEHLVRHGVIEAPAPKPKPKPATKSE